MVRLSPSPISRSSCKVTLPYTVPWLSSKTMPVPLVETSSTKLVPEAIPPLARTMALLLTFRLIFEEERL